MTTPKKGFDELIANQSQPHVPINSTFRALDAIVQLVAIDFATAPPGSPSEGDVYIVDVGATGAFAGHDSAVAYYSGGWQFSSPEQGWLAYVKAEASYYSYGAGSPAGWEIFSAGGGGGGSLSVSGTGSPGQTVENVDTLIFDGDGVEVSEDSNGVARITITGTSGGGGGGSSAQGITPDDIPASPNAMDDEFEGSSLDAKWTWFQQGGTVVTVSRGGLVMRGPVDNAPFHIRGIYQAHSGARIYRGCFSGYNPNNFNQALFGLMDSASGRIVTCGVQRTDGQISVDKWTNEQTYSSSPFSAASRHAYAQGRGGWGYVELETTATNWIFRASPTGLDDSFIELANEAFSSFLAAPDRVLLGVNGDNAATGGKLYCKWFRRIA